MDRTSPAITPPPALTSPRTRPPVGERLAAAEKKREVRSSLVQMHDHSRASRLSIPHAGVHQMGASRGQPGHCAEGKKHPGAGRGATCCQVASVGGAAVHVRLPWPPRPRPRLPARPQVRHAAAQAARSSLLADVRHKAATSSTRRTIALSRVQQRASTLAARWGCGEQLPPCPLTN